MKKSRGQEYKAKGIPVIDKILQSSFLNPAILGDEIQQAGSDQVGFYMDAGLFFISTDYSSVMLKAYFDRQNARVALVHKNGKVLGIITRDLFGPGDDDSTLNRPISDYTVPWNNVPTAGYFDLIEDVVERCSQPDSFLVVMNKRAPVGVLFRNDLPWHEEDTWGENTVKLEESGLEKIIDHLPEGFVVTDNLRNIVYFNSHVANMLPRQRRVIGKKFEIVFGDLFANHHRQFLAAGFLDMAADTLTPVHNVECNTVTGLSFLINFMPIVYHGTMQYLVVSFRDITSMRRQQKEEAVFFDDLTHAFKLMLPDVGMERSLKNIPEYKDNFDPDTGQIEITGVIPDGGFKHVINCLKIASELSEKGVFEIPQIEKGIVIQALIAHDIGKKQPQLNIGDVVNPKECFENGKIHAHDSAVLISELPMIFSADVVTLVKYHHHAENELPADYPARLLPHLRLVQLIDGLSAGLTRKEARLSFNVESTRVTVFETNPNPKYNGIIEVDLFSGQQAFHQLAI